MTQTGPRSDDDEEDGDAGLSQAADLRSYGRRHGRKLSPRQTTLLAERLPDLRVNLAAPPPTSLAELFAPRGAPASNRSADQNPRGCAVGNGSADEEGEHPTARAPDARAAGEHGHPKAQQARAGCASSHPKARAPDAQAAGERGHPKAQQVWLEIGFGGGEHLVWQAERNPHVGLIGCEPFDEGVVKVLTAIDERGLANIRLHPDDARPLLRWLPAASLDRAFILFPDPWPKARHRKRRLVNVATLDLLARALKPGAELRVATDIGDYLRTMLAAFRDCPQFAWQATGPSDWRVRPDDWPETRYEAKAVAEGRCRYYLTFRRI